MKKPFALAEAFLSPFFFPNQLFPNPKLKKKEHADSEIRMEETQSAKWLIFSSPEVIIGWGVVGRVGAAVFTVGAGCGSCGGNGCHLGIRVLVRDEVRR